MAVDFRGDDSWKQNSVPRWQPNGWQLDKVTVPWRGSITGRAAFLASLVQWQQWTGFDSQGSAVDGNMYLEAFPQDDHQRFPTISLTYTGKRNGRLPPDKHESSSSIQQSTGIVFSNAYILTFGLPPHWQAKITYTSAIARKIVWTRTTPNFDVIGPSTAPDIRAQDIESLVIGGIDFSAPGVLQRYRTNY